jgi:hypothetical protein
MSLKKASSNTSLKMPRLSLPLREEERVPVPVAPLYHMRSLRKKSSNPPLIRLSQYLLQHNRRSPQDSISQLENTFSRDLT